MNADELKTLFGRSFHFEAQLDRLSNALGDLVERPRLGMASRQLRDGRNIEAFLVALDDDIELAWQSIHLSLYSTQFVAVIGALNADHFARGE